MSTETLKSHFTFPLNKQGLKEGPKKDYTIKVAIGGGKNTVTIKFINPDHRHQMSSELSRVAEANEVELTLDIAA